MSTTITNDLHGTNTSDMFELLREARKYNYTVSASGGGKLSFRVEWMSTLHPQGQPNKELWSKIEDKSKIQSGTELKGSFTAPESFPKSGQARIRLYFTRAILSEGVDYKFTMSPA
jgi:hypothetical protein